ncbi:MAG: DUF1801 domain-containing protein [Hyphomicrobium sp.]
MARKSVKRAAKSGKARAAKPPVKKAAKPLGKKAAKRGAKATPAKTSAVKRAGAASKLLSGGNPQIAKGYGDAPVQTYIAAMPGWKRDVGRRIDALVARAVPNVRKAVKWNSPLYGAAAREGTWFLSFHCFNRYVKVAFFEGAKLKPPPPGASTQKLVRYLDVYDGDALDEARFVRWVKQASAREGVRM